MATVLTQSSKVRPQPNGYKVDISRGQRIGRVSSEWFSRPDDERYLSLSTLYAAVRARAERATTRTVETRDVKVEASRENAERLALIIPGRDRPVAPTHWSFGQLCSLVGAPSGYPHAHRQVAMLCIHDQIGAGVSLRDIADELLQSKPNEWRSSSERSDLRRLADAAADMVAGGYRRLLASRPIE